MNHTSEITAEPEILSFADRFARVITEVCAPWVIVLFLPLAVAWEATGSPAAALGWGLLVAVTSSLLPMGVIVWGARTGRWDGHHVRDRSGRLVPLLALISMSAVGLGLLLALGAPWPMIALDIAMIVALLVTSGVTAWWKVSLHAAVAAGAVPVLAAIYGPACWILLALVVAVSWSRVRLDDHTAAQVTVGALAGIAMGGGLFIALL